MSETIFFHDMTDDYKMRWYRYEITLQEGFYKGHVWHEFGTNGYGVKESFLEDMLNLYDPSTEEYWFADFFGDTTNDCSLRLDSNVNGFRFILRNDVGDILEKRISKEELHNYIVGIQITDCKGYGKQKERRTCSMCSNFEHLTDNQALKGICKKREKLGNIYAKRTICAHDFIELEANTIQ